MIKRYNNISLLLGAPGIILQIAGNVMRMDPNNPNPLGLPLLGLGTVMLIAGLVFYALAKGRSGAWGLMGFLSIIGLIVLACLKDYAPDGDTHSTTDHFPPTLPPTFPPSGPPPMPPQSGR